MDGIAARIIRDQAQLASQRGNFEGQWQEISERAMPRSSGLFFSAGATGRTIGEKKTEKMFDATAAIALERYASVLASLLTPESQKWHRLRSTNPALNKNKRVLDWFDQAADALFLARRTPRSGFYGQMNMLYQSVGAFGTGLVYVDWSAGSPVDPGGGLRYRHTHLSEAFIRENFQGVVDAVIRKFPMSHRMAAQMLSASKIDRLPKKVSDMLASGKDSDREFAYIHCVMPNEEYEDGKADYRGMAWVEHYVCVETQEVIATRGYRSFPFAVGRPVVSPGEMYGRSPAMTVLPNIKVLNEQKRTQLKMGHRLVDPVLLAHDDGVLDTFSLKPGAINVGGVNAQGQRLVQRLDDNVGQLPQMKDLMEQERGVINDAFLITLFQILVETPRMTATEVLERAREKATLLAPTMGRLQSELLGPLIEREMDLMVRNGRLPPMPRELVEADGEYHIIYDSPLARLMRAEEAAGFSRWTEQLLTIAQVTQDPGALDWIDWDTAAPELADINAVPSRWIADEEKVAAKRQGRQQQAAVQTAIDAGPAVAGLIKAGAGGPR